MPATSNAHPHQERFLLCHLHSRRAFPQVPFQKVLHSHLAFQQARLAFLQVLPCHPSHQSMVPVHCRLSPVMDQVCLCRLYRLCLASLLVQGPEMMKGSLPTAMAMVTTVTSPATRPTAAM